MGRNKRKHESAYEEDKIRRKIVKLQQKLGKKSKRRRIIESSSSESEIESFETWADVHMAPSSLPPESHLVSPQHAAEPTAATSAATVEALPVADSAVNVSDTEKELESDILELLGDAPKTDIVLGPAIHKDIATRWQDLLSKGLQKETKEKLLKEYVTPSNCDLLVAPELNPETKAALPEALIKRDSSIFAKQKQIGIALSALAVTMDRVLREERKQNILKPLSDACRILCDSHFCETRTRRNFVLGAVNSTMKDTLLNARRDKYLFGENVTEKLKAAKTIQKSGDDLKVPAPQKTQFNKNNFVKRNNNLNSQHRKAHPRGETRAARGGFTQQRPITRNSVQSQREKAPPPPPPPPRQYRSSPPRRSTRR